MANICISLIRNNNISCFLWTVSFMTALNYWLYEACVSILSVFSFGYCWAIVCIGWMVFCFISFSCACNCCFWIECYENCFYIKLKWFLWEIEKYFQRKIVYNQIGIFATFSFQLIFIEDNKRLFWITWVWD